MESHAGFLKRNLLTRLLSLTGLILIGCSSAGEPAATATLKPSVTSAQGASVTIARDGQEMVITNHTPNSIYQLAFPSEILPVIEWAPCPAPEECPVDQRIDPGEEKRIELQTIVTEKTKSVTVFWWDFIEKEPGEGTPQIKMLEPEVRVPSG